MPSLPSAVAGNRELVLPDGAVTGHQPPVQPGIQRPVAIDIEDVSKRFQIGADVDLTIKERLLAFRPGRTNHFEALKHVDFQVVQGESFGILGHNGSGKSTLLKIVAGTLAPTTGRVRVAGRLSALLELGAGFHPDLSGRENIYLNGSILGFPKAEVDRIFDEIIDFAGLEEFVDLQVKYYSSGMTARLGFAVATNLDPDVLLVDEVLAVGDEAFQLKCFERVRRFRELGRTMVIVSHGPERIRDLCDRALVLEKGRMLYVGDVDTAIETYREALHGPSEEPKTADTADTKNEDRPNDGPFTIDEVHIGDPSSETPQVFEPGQSVPVVVSYTARTSMAVRIRLVLRSAAGVVMINRSTLDILDRPISPPVGRNSIRFVLDRLPLLDGTYMFTVLIETPDGTTSLDRIGKAGEIKVVGPGAGFGQVALDVSCEELSVD